MPVLPPRSAVAGRPTTSLIWPLTDPQIRKGPPPMSPRSSSSSAVKATSAGAPVAGMIARSAPLVEPEPAVVVVVITTIVVTPCSRMSAGRRDSGRSGRRVGADGHADHRAMAEPGAARAGEHIGGIPAVSGGLLPSPRRTTCALPRVARPETSHRPATTRAARCTRGPGGRTATGRRARTPARRGAGNDHHARIDQGGLCGSQKTSVPRPRGRRGSGPGPRSVDANRVEGAHGDDEAQQEVHRLVHGVVTLNTDRRSRRRRTSSSRPVISIRARGCRPAPRPCGRGPPRSRRPR